MASAALSNSGSLTNANTALPVDPFRSLYVHFGMLLGVDDFQTLDAYHRGKMWFHTAWLHREGVIWGLEVELPKRLLVEGEEGFIAEEDETIPTGELRVKMGAATDARGRELYLDKLVCLNIKDWFEKHRSELDLREDGDDYLFDGHVTIEFRSCLDRQVPAISEPCDGATNTTAYSRVEETVKLCLHPGKAPDWRALGELPFHRVRLLLGLDDAIEDDDGVVIDSDQEVLDKRAEIMAASDEDRAQLCLKWLRHFSVDDEMELSPEQVDAGSRFNIFPDAEPSPVYLANICNLRIPKSEKNCRLLDGEVDNHIRPVHIPTTTTQELVCASHCVSGSSGDGDKKIIPDAPKDAGGPRIEDDSVEWVGETITFKHTGPSLLKASVDPRAVNATVFDNRDGWSTLEIKEAVYEQDKKLVTLKIRDAARGRLRRLIVKGTGEYPILGRNGIPLAGGAKSGPGSAVDGNDFVYMQKKSGS